MSMTATSTEVVHIGDREFAYHKPWDGRPLATRGYVAFDTETEMVTDRSRFPRMALASASAGGSASCLIHPDQVGAFILAHPSARFVFHGVAFDFWVVDRHLRERGEGQPLEAWWDACDGNRMSDTMLLDMLIELARRDADPVPRDLGIVGQLYSRLEINKDDPYRHRYGEIIGKDWTDVEDGFFTYAIKDPIVTLQAYRAMVLEAHRLMAEFSRTSPDLHDDAISTYGLFSEFIQVKSYVALEQISRAGLHLDLDVVMASEIEVRARLDAAVESLQKICPGLFKNRRDKTTGLFVPIRTESGVPSRSDGVLQLQLARVIDEVRQQTGQILSIPRTKRGLSQSREIWSEHAHLHPFLGSWMAVAEQSQICQFFAGLREPVVHSRYRPLVRTGRTSCSGPNLQQIPRDSEFRQGCVARAGHFLLAADYMCGELVTLASICQKRYGHSTLADIFRRGIDPHCYTAAMILGVSLDEFMGWKDDDDLVEIKALRKPLRKHFKQARQNAKPINFGVPGGLGARALVAYARNVFGVEMILEQAKAFRTKLITEIYPELAKYLDGDDMSLLARNLGASDADLWHAFDRNGTHEGFITGGIRNIVLGKTLNAQGNPYPRSYYEGVWEKLIGFCRDPELKELLRSRQGSKLLAGRLFGSGIATLTGRIRGRVSYTQCRNTPFQGLAADGAKLALFRLLREGFLVSGFVHDEILIELPEEGGYVSLAVVERVLALMCESMASVLFGGIPVGCTASLSRCWSKDAELIVRGDRVYPWEPGMGSPPTEPLS